jgi:ubiquinol oxidase
MTSPAIAYDLNKHVERHAYNTYDEFLKTHGEDLKLQPAPQVAVDYYRDG